MKSIFFSLIAIIVSSLPYVAFANNIKVKMLYGGYDLQESSYSDKGSSDYDSQGESFGIMSNYSFTENWSIDLGYKYINLHNHDQCSKFGCVNWKREMSQTILAPKYQLSFRNNKGYVAWKLGAALTRYNAQYEKISDYTHYGAVEVGFQPFSKFTFGVTVANTKLKDLNGDSDSTHSWHGFIEYSF